MSWQVADDSMVEFKVKKLWGLLRVRGQMAVRKVELELDGANPENWSVYAEIDPASVNSGNARRDKHLRTADFFDTGRYPVIIFRSTKVQQVDENSLKLTGELTIKSISRQVELMVNRVNGTTAASIEFVANTTLLRSDFGLNFSRIPIGPEVEISLELRAIHMVNFPVNFRTLQKVTGGEK